jgi:exopolyphosphatase/guanosine-5'-triphosphate,3'-diphosphate pyrophosphatase
MSAVRRAVIDVGTNSVKVLVADVVGRGIQPVFEDSKQTRLGRGFYETRRLQAEPITKTAAAVKQFAAAARLARAVSIRVIATSAARDAVNPGELAQAIEQASGLKMEIISGDQEAEWAFRGVTTDPDLAAQPLLLLEAGGGSAQFILGQGEHKQISASFPIGTVRLMEKFPHSDPPRLEELSACRGWLQDFLAREVQPLIEPALRGEMKPPSGAGQVLLVGVGGSASILARIEAGLDNYDRGRIEATRLSLERLHWQVSRLWGLPLEERRKIVGLPPKRADVILNGVIIYEAVMERFGFSELRISTRGLRFAALMDGAAA